MENKKQRLERASKHIGAVKISPRRWRYFADEVNEYIVISECNLAKLCDFLDDECPEIRRDAYSHWCAATG